MGSLSSYGRAIRKSLSLVEGQTLLHDGTYDSRGLLDCSA